MNKHSVSVIERSLKIDISYWKEVEIYRSLYFFIYYPRL